MTRPPELPEPHKVRRETILQKFTDPGQVLWIAWIIRYVSAIPNGNWQRSFSKETLFNFATQGGDAGRLHGWLKVSSNANMLDVFIHIAEAYLEVVGGTDTEPEYRVQGNLIRLLAQ